MNGTIAVSPMGVWECPCGQEPPKKGDTRPVQTVNALREPSCRFCARKQEDEYRRYPSGAATAAGAAF